MLVHELKKEKEFLYKFSYSQFSIFFSPLSKQLYICIKSSYWKWNLIMKKGWSCLGSPDLWIRFFVSQSKHKHLSSWIRKRASVWSIVFRAALLECLRDRKRNGGRKRKTMHFARKLKTPRGRREATIDSNTVRSALGSARSSLT